MSLAPYKTQVVFEVPPSHAPDGVKGYTLNAQITIPDKSLGERPVVFVMWPGATFSRAYWDLQPQGHPNLSFVEHMRSRGIITIAADPLGVHENLGPQDGGKATIETMATASTGVVADIRERLAAGTLVDGLPPLRDPFVVGGGHSLGGITSLIEQVRYKTYDAIAPLGVPHLDFDVYAERHLGADRSEAALWAGAVESSSGIVGDAMASGQTYITVQKRPEHYAYLLGPEVDQRLWAYDAPLTARCPVNVIVETEKLGRILEVSMRVTGPVFIGLGEHEVADVGAHRYAAAYASSDDITIYLLRGAGHCHNYHPNATQMFDRLATWATGLAQIA
jgi:Alpha/beta hydrolase family